MIPDFDTNGNLPIGIHEATLEEFKEHFAINLIRLDLFEKLKHVIFLLNRFNCRAIFIDGSYVTSKINPNDIDMCWDDKDVNYQYADLMAPILFKDHDEQKAELGIDVLPAYCYNTPTKTHFIDFFQSDTETGLAKGIIKIKLR
jgi:hypothetical protein